MTEKVLQASGAAPATSRIPGIGMTVAAATMFAFKGVLVKLAFIEGVSLAVLLFVRFSLATPMFWMGFRGVSAIRSLSAIDGRGWLNCFLAGACYFGSVLLDFKAIELIPVGVERLLFFSYPVFVIALSAIVFRMRPTSRQILGLVVIQFGLSLVVGVFESLALTATMWIGTSYALAAALFYAVFLLLAQATTRRVGTLAFTVLANTFTFITIVVWYFAAHSVADIDLSARAFTYVAAISVLCTVVPFFLLFEGIRRIGSTPAALISTVGPVITVAASVGILGERLSGAQAAGMILVLGGVVWLERPRKAHSQ